MKKFIAVVSCLVCALLIFSSVSFATEGKPVKGEKFFTRTNLKNKGTTIFFHNMSKVKGTIPVGTPVTIKSAGGNAIRFKIDGEKKTYVIKDRATLYDKYLVSSKDEIGLQNMSDKVKAAVKAMVVYEGMTKNEVFVSKGCPAYIGHGEKSERKTLEELMASNSWYYNMDTRAREMIITFTDGDASTIVRR